MSIANGSTLSDGRVRNTSNGSGCAARTNDSYSTSNTWGAAQTTQPYGQRIPSITSTTLSKGNPGFAKQNAFKEDARVKIEKQVARDKARKQELETQPVRHDDDDDEEGSDWEL